MQATVFSDTSVQFETLKLLKRVKRPAKSRIRADALPEMTRYRDDGCDISESCLNCPLPRCRYEEPGGLRALINSYRDEQMIQLRMQGMGVAELAEHFNVSRRTVFRVIGEAQLAPRPTRRGIDTTPIPIRVTADADTRKEAHCA